MVDRFAEKVAITVMVRATMENALAPEPLDELFAKIAERQYARQLLFLTLVALMAVVVCRVRKSVHAAFKAMQDEIPVSLTTLYDMLDGTEANVSAALGRHTATRLRAAIEATGGALPPLFPGYRTKILDGNHLAATQRRIKPLRGCKAGPLPGFGLVVLDPALMLAITLTHPLRRRARPGKVSDGADRGTRRAGRRVDHGPELLRSCSHPTEYNYGQGRHARAARGRGDRGGTVGLLRRRRTQRHIPGHDDSGPRDAVACLPRFHARATRHSAGDARRQRRAPSAEQEPLRPRAPRLARLRYRNKQHVSTFRLLPARRPARRAP
ncbi:MAG: hypothetical protein HY905_00255 [Deltaproteobacteria bacterium]|nr:hypothetical protein [Deltaproteobacteria bacterium]